MLVRHFQRELRLCFRNKMSLLNAFLFVIIVCSIFPLATTPNPKILSIIAPGVIWISALLAMLLSMNALFKEDYLDGTLDQMLMLKNGFSYYVFSKVMSLWCLLVLPIIVITPVIAILYDLNAHGIEMIMLGLLLGTPSLSLIAAIIAALTLGLRNSGLLLLLMALPLYAPIIIFGTMAASSASPLAQFGFLAAILALALTALPVGTAAVLKMRIAFD